MIEKIPGVGTVNIFGDNSALRVSFNPHKLAFYNITIPELISKLNDNNTNENIIKSLTHILNVGFDLLILFIKIQWHVCFFH